MGTKLSKAKFDSEAFGNYLRNLREKRRISQGEVAEVLGYKSPQFISNWERGIAAPPLKTLIKLAEIYNVEAEVLYKNFVQHINRQMLHEFKKIVNTAG